MLLVIHASDGYNNQTIVFSNIAPYNRGTTKSPQMIGQQHLLVHGNLQVGHLILVKPQVAGFLQFQTVYIHGNDS